LVVDQSDMADDGFWLVLGGSTIGGSSSCRHDSNCKEANGLAVGGVVVSTDSFVSGGSFGIDHEWVW
jgi:hypothetical protein